MSDQSLFSYYYKNRSFLIEVDQEKIKDLLLCDYKEDKKKSDIKEIEKDDKTITNRQFFVNMEIPLKKEENLKTRVFVKVSNEENYKKGKNGAFVEVLITTYVIPYIIRSHSPHFTNFITSATCTVLKDKGKSVDPILIDPKKKSTKDNSKKYEKFMGIFNSSYKLLVFLETISEYDAPNISQVNWNFLITEAIDENVPTFDHLISNILNYSREKQKRNEIYDAILFQLIWSVLCLNILGINHNDLHRKNIFVKILKPEEIKEIRYYLDEENYFSRKDPVFVKIIDLDLATWPNVLINGAYRFGSEEKSKSLQKVYNEKVCLQDFYKVLRIFANDYDRIEQLKDLADILNTDPNSLPFSQYFYGYEPICNKQIIYDFFSKPIKDEHKVKNPFYDNNEYKRYSVLNLNSFNILSKWNIVEFIFCFLCGFFSKSLQKSTDQQSPSTFLNYYLPKKDQEWDDIISTVKEEFKPYS